MSGNTEINAYRARVAEIIIRSEMALGHHRMYDTLPSDTTLEAWTEILIEEIPLSLLGVCYLHAMRHQSVKFHLSVTDLIDAFYSDEFRSRHMRTETMLGRLRQEGVIKAVEPLATDLGDDTSN
jgi:hypothetical protein